MKAKAPEGFKGRSKKTLWGNSQGTDSTLGDQQRLFCVSNDEEPEEDTRLLCSSHKGE